MSNAIALSTPRLQTDKPKRSLAVTGRLKDACDLMVFGKLDGPGAGIALAMDEAAKAVGIETRYIRKALDKPHVRQYLFQQKQVFRASASAQNISRLVAIRDQDDNKMAALGAIKLIEDADDQHGRATSIRSPGVVIQIVNQGPNGGKPLQTLNVVPNSRSVDEPE